MRDAPSVKCAYSGLTTKAPIMGRSMDALLESSAFLGTPGVFFFRKFSVVTRFDQEVNDLSWLTPIFVQGEKKDKFSESCLFFFWCESMQTI